MESKLENASGIASTAFEMIPPIPSSAGAGAACSPGDFPSVSPTILAPGRPRERLPGGLDLPAPAGAWPGSPRFRSPSGCALRAEPAGCPACPAPGSHQDDTFKVALETTSWCAAWGPIAGLPRFLPLRRRLGFGRVAPLAAPADGSMMNPWPGLNFASAACAVDESSGSAGPLPFAGLSACSDSRLLSASG